MQVLAINSKVISGLEFSTTDLNLLQFALNVNRGEK